MHDTRAGSGGSIGRAEGLKLVSNSSTSLSPKKSKRGTGQISGVAFADTLFFVFADESALALPLQVFQQCISSVFTGSAYASKPSSTAH